MDRKNPAGEKPKKSQAELDAATIRSHIIGNFNNFFRILEILEERKRELGFTPLHEEPHGKWFVGEDYVSLIEKHLTPIKEIMEAKGDSSTYKLVEFIGKVKATKGKQDGKDIYLIDTFELETIKAIILSARNRYAPDPLAATGIRIRGRWITPADAPKPEESPAVKKSRRKSDKGIIPIMMELNRGPKKITELEATGNLGTAKTIGKYIGDLIDKGWASRPGERSKIKLTETGAAFLEQYRVREKKAKKIAGNRQYITR